MNTAPCRFTENDLVVLCYVEDLVLFRANEDSIDNFSDIGKHFQMKNLSRPTLFLGLVMNWTTNGAPDLIQE